jgi:hypothetical protein
LAIYAYAYYARLLECLGDEFPVLTGPPPLLAADRADG